ncbi:unnamed protein product [Urochloa decumbens]|uniref:Uncharacterized protein n=1 Tax=Urochloa decumbens TaxID=240449 RepID=A0ABC8WY95_9POAL
MAGVDPLARELFDGMSDWNPVPNTRDAVTDGRPVPAFWRRRRTRRTRRTKEKTQLLSTPLGIDHTPMTWMVR